MGSGVLTVNGVYLRGSLTIGTEPFNPPALFLNHGLINFGGTLSVGATENSMGQLGLSTNGTINLESSALVVRFADSSTLDWDPNSRLTIAGWNGAYSGGGSNQIYFGNSSGGLTLSQLSQVRFSNPAGLLAGTYPAKILGTGEVVPAQAAIQFTRNGSTLSLTWPSGWFLQSAMYVTGPYSDVEATSSYEVDITSPQQFFRLRQ